jgi:hypothetical protein
VPCTQRLLTPALSSFGEERETDLADRGVHGFNARMAWGDSLPGLFLHFVAENVMASPGIFWSASQNFDAS